nr:MAG TPA: Flavin adenine dinucleotide (FAD)-dependent sulfhydryl oxidase [Caudoviricetes sp.]DAQ49997.1 MAG TPA: Flavin adenine dinucleotide (FAD)-dependent sulfhydryl oxidase [Caudoviricetes sp.]
MLCYDVTTQSEKINPEAFAALRGFIYPLSKFSN